MIVIERDVCKACDEAKCWEQDKECLCDSEGCFCDEQPHGPFCTEKFCMVCS